MATLFMKSDLIVSGYIRKLQGKFEIDIPKDIWLIVIMFYPNCIDFEGNTMNLSLREKCMITEWFMDIFEIKDEKSILSSKLLYDCNRDGKSGQDFRDKCIETINTFSIVQTTFNGHIFGCFVSQPFYEQEISHFINDEKAFLCVIRSCFDDKAPEIFRVKEATCFSAYYNSKSWGPAFGSRDLTLFGDKQTCDVNHEATYFNGPLCGNVLCGGDIFQSENKFFTFYIEKMNTFTIEIEEP